MTGMGVLGFHSNKLICLRHGNRSPLGVGSRTLSLHTLLDYSINEEAGPGAVSTPEKGSAKAGNLKSLDALRKKATAATWARKQEVIDGVNELIEELKDIDSSIANQVCLWGLALFVGSMKSGSTGVILATVT